MNRRTHAATVLGVAFLLIATACSERMGRGFDWKRMRSQAKYAPYGASDFSTNGAAMRAPPVGTVARESMSAAESRPHDTDLARGASRFQIYCAVCHGDRGDGVSLVGQNMDDPKPPSLLVPPASALATERLFDVVTEGVGHMPSFAAELSAVDRWQVVMYVSELQRRAATGSQR